MINNILTTYPEKQVEVGIYTYQNKLVGSGTTGNNGIASIPLQPGKPYYILATQGKQRSYLRIDEGLSLSLSNFDVSGEEVRKGIKGFIYGDRGGLAARRYIISQFYAQRPESYASAGTSGGHGVI